MYIATFALSTYLIARAQRSKGNKKKLLIIFSMLLPAILAGLRDYTIGRDVLIYGNEWFRRATISSSLIQYIIDANRNGINAGYACLNYFVSLFTDNAHWFYFVLALLNNILVYYSLKPFSKEISIPLAFLIFYFFYFNESLNMMRQTTAMLFVLLSANHIRERKIFKFALCLIFAYLFHSSAIVGLILYPLLVLSDNRYRKSVTYLLYFVALFIVFNLSNVMRFAGGIGVIDYNKFSVYISDSTVILGGRYIRIIFFGLIFLIFTIKREMVIRTEKKISPFSFVSGLYVYCAFSFILSFLMLISSISYVIRMAYYFDIFLIIYMPMVAKEIRIKSKHKKLLNSTIVLLPFIVYWLFVFVIRGGGATIPYKFMTF